MNDALVLGPRFDLRTRLSTTLLMLVVVAALWAVLGFAYRNAEMWPPFSLWDPTPAEVTSYHYVGVDQEGRRVEGWYSAPDRWLQRDFHSVRFSDGETVRDYLGAVNGYVFHDIVTPYAADARSDSFLLSSFWDSLSFNIREFGLFLEMQGGEVRIERTMYLGRAAFRLTHAPPGPGDWRQWVFDAETLRMLAWDFKVIGHNFQHVTSFEINIPIPDEVFIFDLPGIHQP